jgi:predicted permease
VSDSAGRGASWRFELLSELLRDVHHGWRMIRRTPGVTAVVVISLAIGIGFNIAVFSWIQAVGYRPMPGVADASRFQIVQVETADGHAAGSSWLEYRDLRSDVRSFRDLFAYRMAPLAIGVADETERAYGMLVSGNYFTALGLRPAAGRFLRPDEVERAGAEPVTIISWDLWSKRFGREPSAIGSRIVVNAQELTIVGVTPRGFQGTILGLTFDLWVPATLAPVLLGGSREIDDRRIRGYSLMASLVPGTTAQAAQLELNGVMQRMESAYPETNRGMRAKVLSFWDAPRGPQRLFVSALKVLQGVMLLLLLAVCGNTANLVLARAGARRREMSVRLALGGGRWRVVALILTENLVLAMLAAGLGTLLAIWLTRALSAIPISGALPIRFQAGVDVIGLLLAIALALTCGMIFGLAPALQLARVDAQRVLRAGADMTSRSALRNVLMGAEVGLAVIVLLVAALFFRRFSDTRVTDTGFRRDGVLLAAYDLTGRGGDATAARIMAANVLDRLRALPGVEAAAIATSVPLDLHGLPLRPFTVEGRARTDGVLDVASTNTVTPGYFETMGIALEAGRDFAALNDPAAPPQAVVNAEFARRFTDDGDAVGRWIESNGRRYTIAGVVRNSLYDAFGEEAKPFIYLSYRDRNVPVAQIHLRTRAGGEMLLAGDIRRVLRDLDPSLPVYDVRTLADHVDRNLFLRRVPARIFSVLGPLLLGLAVAGIYAVVSYSVSQRRNEIGLRLALGASPRRIVAQVLEDSLAVIVVGALAGSVVAFVVNRQMSGGAIDFVVFGGVPLILLAFATLACWLPARQATRIDPMVVLRQE